MSASATTLETFALVIVTAIVLGLVNKALDRLFEKKRKSIPTDANGKPIVFITRDELDKYCDRRQDTCAAKQNLEFMKKTVAEFKDDIKSDIAELKQMVIEAIKKG